MNRRQWLRNDMKPSLARAPTFDVRESPVILTASGLALADVIPIELRVDATSVKTVGVEHAWAPLYIGGNAISLRGDNTQLVISVPGTYRHRT